MSSFLDDYNIDFDAPFVPSKRDKLSKASQDKRQALNLKRGSNLVGLDTTQIYDGDQVLPGTRLGSPEEGHSFDAYEVAQGKDLRYQKDNLANTLGIHPSTVTDEMIYAEGQKDKQRYINLLKEGQKFDGPMPDGGNLENNPTVDVGFWGDYSKGAGSDRPMVSATNPVTGKNIMQVLNTPETNAGYNAPFNKAKQFADLYAKLEKERDRTLGETLSDTGISLAKSGVRSGQLAYGAGEAIYDTVKRALGVKQDAELDPEIGGYSIEPDFNRTIKFLDSMMSDPTKVDKLIVKEDAKNRDEGRNTRLKALQKEYNIPEWGAKLIDGIADAGHSIKSYVNNPYALADMGLESAIHMANAAAVGKGFINQSIKGMTKKQLESKAGQKAIQKAAEKGGVTYTALAEGIYGGIDAKERVLDTSHEELYDTSEKYRKMIDEGVSQSEAKAIAADDARYMATAIQATVGGLSSKLTGAGKFEGGLAKPTEITGKSLIKGLGKGVAQGLKEVPEEGIQEGSAQAVSNLIDKLYKDETTDITKGVGTAAGAGMATGGVSGVAVSAPKTAIDALKGTSEIAAKGAKKVKETAGKVGELLTSPTTDKDAVKKEDIKAPYDEADSPLKKVNKILSSDLDTDTKKQFAQEQLNTLKAELDTISNDPKASTQDKQIAAAKVFTASSKIADISIDNASTKLKSNTPDTTNTSDAYDINEKLIGSEPSVEESKAIDKILSSDKVDTNIKQAIKFTQDMMVNLRDNSGLSKRDQSRVNNEIYGDTVTNDKKGLERHIRDISTAMLEGKDPTKAIKELQNFASYQEGKTKAFEDKFNQAVNTFNSYPAKEQQYTKLKEKDFVTVSYGNEENPWTFTIKHLDGADKFLNTLRTESKALNDAVAISNNLVKTKAPIHKVESSTVPKEVRNSINKNLSILANKGIKLPPNLTKNIKILDDKDYKLTKELAKDIETHLNKQVAKLTKPKKEEVKEKSIIKEEQLKVKEVPVEAPESVSKNTPDDSTPDSKTTIEGAKKDTLKKKEMRVGDRTKILMAQSPKKDFVFKPYGREEEYVLKVYGAKKDKNKFSKALEIREEDSVYNYNKDYIWAIENKEGTKIYSSEGTILGALSTFESLSTLAEINNENLSQLGTSFIEKSTKETPKTVKSTSVNKKESNGGSKIVTFNDFDFNPTNVASSKRESFKIYAKGKLGNIVDMGLTSKSTITLTTDKGLNIDLSTGVGSIAIEGYRIPENKDINLFIGVLALSEEFSKKQVKVDQSASVKDTLDAQELITDIFDELNEKDDSGVTTERDAKQIRKENSGLLVEDLKYLANEGNEDINQLLEELQKDFNPLSVKAAREYMSENLTKLLTNKYNLGVKGSNLYTNNLQDLLVLLRTNAITPTAKHELLDKLITADKNSLGVMILDTYIEYNSYPSTQEFIGNSVTNDLFKVADTYNYKDNIDKKNVEKQFEQYLLFTDSSKLFNKSGARNTILTEHPYLVRKLGNPKYADSIARFKEQTGLDVNNLDNINHFFRTGTASAGEVVKGIKKSLNLFKDKHPKKEEYIDNPLMMFADEDGNLPYALVDTMGLVGMQYLGTEAKSTIRLTDEYINSIFGKDTNNKLTDEMLEVFPEGTGKPLANETSQLGAKVLNSLGLSFADKAPPHFKEKLQEAIGMAIITGLSNRGMGVVNINSITGKAFEYAEKAGKDSSVDGVTNTVSVKTDLEENEYFSQQVPIAQVKDYINLFEAGKNAKVFEDALGLSRVASNISYEPITQVDTRVGDMPTITPKEFEKNLEYAQTKSSFKMNLDMVDLLNVLGDDQFLIANQIVTDQDIAKLSGKATQSALAKNEGMRRDLQSLKEFIEFNKENPEISFYFKYNVMANFRSNVDSYGINYQRSKMHRNSMIGSTWAKEIDLDNITKEELEIFKEKLAEPLHIKKAGKQYEDTTLMEFDERIQQEDIKLAVSILQDIHAKKEISDEYKGYLAAIAKEIGEPSTLVALNTIARYMTAKNAPKGQRKFIDSMSKEVDGTTNGTANLLMQLAPNKEEYKRLLNAVGMYFDSNPELEANFLDWISQPGNYDIYEQGGVATATALNDLITNDNKEDIRSSIFDTKKVKFNPIQIKEKFEAFQLLIGDVMSAADGEVTSDVRNFMKDPLLVYAYQAGIPSIVENKIEDIWLDTENSIAEHLNTYMTTKDDVVKSNALQQAGDLYVAINFFSQAKTKDAIATEFNNKVNLLNSTPDLYKNMLKSTGKKGEPHFTKLGFMGKIRKIFVGGSADTIKYDGVFKEAFSEKFAELDERKRVITNATQIGNLIFKAIEEKRMEEFNTKEGRLPNKAEKEAIYQGMLKNGEMLTVKTHMSTKHEEEALLRKMNKKYIEAPEGGRVKLPLGGDEVSLGNTLDYKDGGIVTTESSPKKSISSRIATYEYAENIGVKGGVILNILQDSMLLNKMIGQDNIMDIFDAFIFGANQSRDISKKSNEMNYDNHVNWDYAQEVKNTYDRLLFKGNKLIDMNEINKKFEEQQAELKIPAKDIKTINEFTTELISTVEQIQKDKIDRLASQINSENFPHGHVSGKQTTVPFQAEVNTDLGPIKAEDIKGSQPGIFNPDDFSDIAASTINADTSTSIFNDLGKAIIGGRKEGVTHTQSLSKTLNDIIQPALRSSDAYVLYHNESGKNTRGFNKGSEVYIESTVATDASNLGMSAQEVYVHEMIHAVLKAAIDTVPGMRRELKRLYALAKQSTSPEDLLRKDTQGNIYIPAGSSLQVEKDKAQIRYDYIFDNSNREGYLHEFAAFALSNEMLMNHLENISANRKSKRSPGIVQKIENLFFMLLDKLNGVIYGTSNTNLRNAMHNLARNTTNVNKQNKARVQAYIRHMGNFNRFISTNLKQRIWNPYKNAFDIYYADNKKHGVLSRTIMTPLAAPYLLTHTEFKKNVNKLMRKAGYDKNNPLYELIQEIAGPKKINKKLHVLARQVRKHVTTRRQDIKNFVTKYINDSFDPDIVISPELWREINASLLKTDVSSFITDTSDMNQVNKLISYLKGNKTVDRRIKALEKQLSTIADKGEKNYIVQQSESLGHYMARGIVGINNQFLNANLISMILQDTAKETQAIPIIDELASLWSIRFTDTKSNLNTAKLIDNEYARNTGDKENGIQALLNTHIKFKEQSLADNFNGDPLLMQKGYTKENFAPNKSMVIADGSKEAELKHLGYHKKERVKKDKNDRNQIGNMYIYVSNDGLLNEHLSGAFNIINMAASGTNLLQARMNEEVLKPGKEAGKDLNQAITVAMQSFRDLKTGRRINYNDAYLVPSFNERHYLHSYRYLMNEKNKNELLGKDDQAHTVMGSMFGAMHEKNYGGRFNTQVLKGLKEDYDLHHKDLPEEYKIIDKDSEIYKLIPNATKAEMKSIWGNTPFQVREEVLNLIFGFRKPSAVTYIDELTDKKLLNDFMRHALRIAGRLWKAIVAKAKNVIVILTPAVVTANTISNMLLLAMKGVPLHKIPSLMLEGTKSIIEYDALAKKRDVIKLRLDSNKTLPNRASLEKKLARIEANMATNAISPLIDEGVFQTIAEDINDIDDKLLDIIGQESVKLKLISEKAGDKIPDFVKETFKQATLHPDTKVGGMMVKATQYSDFVARYALYEHQTKTMGMSKEASIEDILESFIDYDLHTSSLLQWLNDMGFLMFTKFLFRIQRVILKAFKDNPGNVAAVELMQQATVDMPDIIQANLLTGNIIDGRMVNPLDGFGIHAANLVPWLD